MRLYTPPSVCQISRQSDTAFEFYSSFCKCAKRGRKIRRKKKNEETTVSQFLKSNISGMSKAISLKFGMWSTEGGGNVHSNIRLVSSRQHIATEVRKLRFLSSCQYTHGVARRLLGPHDTLPCALMYVTRPPAKIEGMWAQTTSHHISCDISVLGWNIFSL